LHDTHWGVHLGVVLAGIGSWWEWFLLSANSFGGKEFVGATIGINIAVLGWKRLAERLSWFMAVVDKKTATFLTYAYDTPEVAKKARIKFLRVSKRWINLFRFAASVLPWASLLFAAIGVACLYFNAYHAWNVIMVAHLVGYALMGSLSWIIITGSYYWLLFGCLKKPMDIDDEIDELRQQINGM
jgi:hypothetical protein